MRLTDLSIPEAGAPVDEARRWWSLGRLAPLVLALWLGLDLLLRFVPPQWFRLHPITLIDGRPLPNSSFTPNYDAVFNYWEGDAISEANLPSTERRTPLRISID